MKIFHANQSSLDSPPVILSLSPWCTCRSCLPQSNWSSETAHLFSFACRWWSSWGWCSAWRGACREGRRWFVSSGWAWREVPCWTSHSGPAGRRRYQNIRRYQSGHSLGWSWAGSWRWRRCWRWCRWKGQGPGQLLCWRVSKSVKSLVGDTELSSSGKSFR